MLLGTELEVKQKSKVELKLEDFLALELNIELDGVDYTPMLRRKQYNSKQNTGLDEKISKKLVTF